MKLKKDLFHSLSSTINAFYIILIVLFTLLTGSIIYYVANSQVSRNTETTMESVLNQKMEYLSSLYREVFEQFYILTKDDSVQQLLEAGASSPNNYLELSENIESLYTRNAAFIDSIYVNIHGYVLTQSDQQSLNEQFNHYGFYELDAVGNEDYYWLNNHTDYVFDREQDVQSLFHILRGKDNEPLGIIIMNLKTSSVERTLREISLDNSYMLLMSNETYYVSEDAPNNEGLDREIYRLYRNHELTNDIEKLDAPDGKSYNIRFATLGTNKWRVVLVTPETKLFDSNATIFLLFIILALLLALIAVLFLRMVRRYISTPIKKMADSMLTTKTYHEKLTWTDEIPQELVILYQTYNDLTDRNVELMEQTTAQQEEKMALEVALLHAQINPHFLYNTLFSIKGLCDLGMNEEASQMISNLSDFFRTSLSRGKEMITIEEEVKNIKSYLYMMEMRYGDFFTYELSIPESLYSYQIVKLSLQPIVENAIYHGVMNDRKRGRIQISSSETEDSITLTVKDNGQGITRETLQIIQAEIHTPFVTGAREETGVGLRSVHIRIKNRYGDQYGLQIESEAGEYTKVLIRIPKIKGEDYA